MKLAAAAWIACASVCTATGAFAQTQASEPLPVYDPTQVAFARYTVLKRLWVDDWRSSIRIAGHRDEAAARRTLLNEAAALGADAVVNLYCLSKTDGLFNPSGYYCYGNAVKVLK